MQKLPNSSEIVLEMIITVYCGDKSYANPAANKSEYIREGENRSKDSSTRDRKSKVLYVLQSL